MNVQATSGDNETIEGQKTPEQVELQKLTLSNLDTRALISGFSSKIYFNS